MLASTGQLIKAIIWRNLLVLRTNRDF